MKRYYIFLLILLPLILHSCQPLSSISVETIVPAKIDFSGDFNKVVFINLETDLNNDQVIDTLLYKMISEEMGLGFLDAIQFSKGIDSSDFFYVRGFPEAEKLYQLDTISWEYIEKAAGTINADLIIVLDSLKLLMTHDEYTEYYSYPTEYYKSREITINAHWSAFDLSVKRRLDQYNYRDSLFWDVVGYSEAEVKRKMPSVERSIREISYFAAVDYANRIFPGWKFETRYFFIMGNKDFKIAADYIKQYKWNEAMDLWEKYAQDIDKEIASRASFNMAFGNEMIGKLDGAIMWAERSNKIKTKARTRNYIYVLKKRKLQLEKLQKQIY